MLFTVLPRRTRPPSPERERAFLISDNWNDFSYVTMFSLIVFDTEGARHDFGEVKIGRFGMKIGRVGIPEEFDTLEERFFSLGQDENYYETLNKISDDLRDRIIKGLRDVADDLSLFEKVLDEPVTRNSLLRNVSEKTVRGRFNRLVKGDAKLTRFQFTYQFPPQKGTETPTLFFEVTPESLPPTNIHVLIGRNGVGKTRCLNGMARSLVEQEAEEAKVGSFSSQDGEHDGLFANLVSVTFSAFDPFEPLVGTEEKPHTIRYSYIGLKQAPGEAKVKRKPPKSVGELAGEFIDSVEKCRSGVRAGRWRKALETLEADPLFKEADVTGLSDGDNDSELKDRAGRLYGKLSSGHKIVLLTITRLVETVDERTIVLLDEPEAHLHPPLLAAFVRSLSDLLVQRNGVAIIATHSPVVVQEAPKTCVWILRRSGVEVRADRPDIETFGENVGVLTREVFGLEVTQSGFHKILEDTVANARTYESVLKRFGHQLGAEARAIARGIIAVRDTEEPEDKN
jgi:ABC-type cobalamin/Fe3+-siderophores transport system ATPase subunit